jgi:primary-amine oxidase
MNRPVEIHHVQLRPSDFFSANPSIDVPSNRNLASKEMRKNGTTQSNGNENGQTCCHRTNGNGIINGLANGDNR